MSASLDNYIDAIEHLPPSPTVVVKLISLFRQPDPVVEKIVSVMSLDPSLTTEVLKRCNSAFYGGEENVVDVFDAIMRVGFYEVYQTAVSWFGQQAISSSPYLVAIDREALWRHSAMTAVAAGQTAQMLGDPPWTVFTAGLLHDVGKTALALQEGQRYSALIANVGKSGTALEQGEQACFGFGHSEIGARLLHRWGVPLEISSIVLYHHFLEWPDFCKRTCSIVHLANSISHSLDGKEIALPSSDRDKNAMSELELTPDDLSEIVSRTQVELEELKGVFFPADQV